MSGIDLAVSTVIFALRPDGDGRLVLSLPLVRRIRPPFENRWSLPGGAADPVESLADTAARKLAETTGLEPSYLEQLYAFGEPNRSPTGRVVSVVYWALVRGDEADRALEGENVTWRAADELPQLAFDHNLIVDYALWRLRTKLGYARIAHAFLGPTFTLAELRQVHEIVLQRPLDPANFRRQIEASGTVVATGEHVTGGRHRPPRLYRYDTTVDPVDPSPLSAAGIR
ncbi:NUDIX domain-containing protein [Homoserinibacter sp. GY 40078]|uniref:NUDIX hydrolase n=1 Tax=Homoserinibacter sp. GY 40078 TaxID=2603275 RepID=UPI0011CB251F|nr:NUDIX domain-containing protein [Homoserinibacter sp. GY 40078]TXK17355.1 NUDIX hydrolase [Homoserinibacter sp. GY 40078]